MLPDILKSYISKAKGMPFFCVVGDDDYNSLLDELKQLGLLVVRTSDFCKREDKVPSLDDLVDCFRTLDIDYRDNKCVVVGLGEYLALRGANFAEKELRRIKNITLGNARVVLLLRGITAQVETVSKEDMRIAAQKRVHFYHNAYTNLSVTNVNPELNLSKENGVKALLKTIEDGSTGNCVASTNMPLGDSLIPIVQISDAYSAIRHIDKTVSVSKELGNEEQWQKLLNDITKYNLTVDEYFDHCGLSDDYEQDIYEKTTGLEYRNWLYFISLKKNIDKITNPYLRYVVTKTTCYEDLKANILTSIIALKKEDPIFDTYYRGRKKLVSNFPESEIAVFIKENSIDPKESIYRYTDNTKLEREAVIKWVSRYGIIKELDYIYPALKQYLKPYVFDCGKESQLLSDYFNQYKVQKVKNSIEPSFLETVKDYALQQRYARLETRDNAIKNIEHKESAFLYWIDALGAEYLSYITELAKKKGLSIHIDIARADLPTITSVNKKFFDEWPEGKKYKEEELDNIKHKEKGGFVYIEGEGPVHLSSELKVIDTAIDRAATKLAMHECKKFVIASDHGASRLAVIHQQEEKYETDTKGEHSGRCCKVFDGYDLPYALEESGYLVLADYGRFKKSRAANVEVHGGASLEEVVVPIITLSLKKQFDVDIRALSKDDIYADRHNGTTLLLYISDVEFKTNVSVVIDGSRYVASIIDESHYKVVLPDIKRAKKACVADVYDADDLIGTVTFDIKSKTSIVKNDFDELF